MFNWIDNIAGKDYTTMTDIEVGMDAISHYNTFAMPIANQHGHLALSFDRMVKIIESAPGGRNMIAGLGFGIKAIEFGEGDVKSAMEKLAIATEGRVPKNTSIFRDALTKEATGLADLGQGYLDSPVGEVFQDLAETTQFIGNTGVDLAKAAAHTAVQVVDTTGDILKYRKIVFWSLIGVGTLLGTGIVLNRLDMLGRYKELIFGKKR